MTFDAIFNIPDTPYKFQKALQNMKDIAWAIK